VSGDGKYVVVAVKAAFNRPSFFADPIYPEAFVRMVTVDET
jgi:hypothetical protein